MKNILKLLFLFFLHASNISSAIFIYSLIYFIFKTTSTTIYWYHFGFLLSVYDFGKFIGVFLWNFLSYKLPTIMLILTSLLFLSLINFSYFFTFSLLHIIFLRFLTGISNNLGRLSKDIYIQLGFKEKFQIIMFILSIICTSFSLLFPSLLIEKFNNFDNAYKFHLIGIILSSTNIVTILLSIILLSLKILKVKKHEIALFQTSKEKKKYNNNIIRRSSRIQQKNEEKSASIKKERQKISEMKMKENVIDSNIPSSGRKFNGYGEKQSINYVLDNNRSPGSKEKKPSTMKLIQIKQGRNKEMTDKEASQGYEIKRSFVININSINRINAIKNIFNLNNKEAQFIFIEVLLDICDCLFLIWNLVILYDQFKQKCYIVSFIYCCIRLIGEILFFPISSIIIKKYSNYPKRNIFKISKHMKVISLLLFLFTVIICTFLFINDFTKQYNKMLVSIFYISIIIRNILSDTIRQMFKIYTTKYYNVNVQSISKLRKSYQYHGTIVKSIFVFFASFGYGIINSVHSLESDNFIIRITPIVYFIGFPCFIYIILLNALLLYL